MPADIDNKEFIEATAEEMKPEANRFQEDFRSQEVQDIISERPGFWGRWALPVFLIILMGIVAGTWFVRYPDTIFANATLIATNGPREIVPRQQGRLTALFVQNGDTLEQGEQIGWIESTADHAQVLSLSTLLDTAITLLNKNETEAVAALFRQNFSNLGELQPTYQQFITAWQQFNDYLANGFYYKKETTLQQDYAFLKQNHQAIENQLELTKKDLVLSRKDYETNEQLFNSKVISAKDYRTVQSTYLNKQQSVPQIEQAIASNENQQVDKQSEIVQLEHTISQQKEIFGQGLHTLKSQVDSWITQYVIKAPVSGRVAFLVPLQKNQFLQANQVLGYVNPSNSQYYARLNFTQDNFGRVNTGQQVQLRLSAYPYEEFGIIRGNLDYISNVASDSGFLGNVTLPDGLTTTYNRRIQFRNGLQAQAVIITKQMRLLQRFYYNVIKKVNK